MIRDGTICGSDEARRAASTTMPSLMRLIFALGLLGGAAYGAMFVLANFVTPTPREITVTIPADRLAKPR